MGGGVFFIVPSFFGTVKGAWSKRLGIAMLLAQKGIVFGFGWRKVRREVRVCVFRFPKTTTTTNREERGY